MMQTTRKSDQFPMRLPDGMRDEIKAAAATNGRSMNAEIVARLSGQQRTLRDEFAMAALTGFMANTNRPTTIAKDDADWCYQIADALLAAREAQP